MRLKNYNTYFFFLLLFAVSMLALFLLRPFWLAIFLAAVLAIVFNNAYLFLLSKLGGRKGYSAFLTSLFAIMVFLVPFLIAGSLVVNELLSIYNQVNGQGDFYDHYVGPLYEQINSNQVLSSMGLPELFSKDTLGSTVAQLGRGTLAVFQSAYQGIAHFIFLSFVVFFSMYYFLIHGKELVTKLMFLSPLKDSHEKILIEKFISMSRATIKGTMVVAFIQGFIGGVTFAIAGIPSAIIWSLVMMLLSLIPMFGSSIIWFPAGIIMLALGHIFEGSLILVVGLLIISLIDNFLRPELVGKDVQIHPLLVFFSTLGGIALFGFFGFIIGPIVMALFLVLWEIYAVDFSDQLKKFNAR